VTCPGSVTGVLAIDASPAMVAAAASVPGAAGRVAAGDAAALPVADAAADCAVAFMSLQDIDHMEQAVAEAARALVPGGRLVIAVTHPAKRSRPGRPARHRPGRGRPGHAATGGSGPAGT
jgi:ubiquinone/menaquinone biosynthesis C-methylase UbiE